MSAIGTNEAPPVLILGPTASGKSALALRLARAAGGAVINADSMQVYADWRVLSARPSPEEEAEAPHLLYGHADAAEAYSVGRWLEEAERALALCAARGLRPIIVGGTGLYFEALTRGLAEIPPIPPEIRAEGAARLAAEGAAGLIPEIDAETRDGLDLRNPRRVLRAWEILKATGRGQADWARATPPPLLPLAQARPLALTPERGWLHARIDARFDAMMKGGALEEARAVFNQGLPADAPALKAHGAPELFAFFRGGMTLEAAVAQAKANTRAYAKRQETWIRGRCADWPRVDPALLSAQFSCAQDADFLRLFN